MFSTVAGSAPAVNSSSLIRCSGAKTGFWRAMAAWASLRDALRAGADKTNMPLAKCRTISLRLSEASLLIRLAFGLQCVSNNPRPSETMEEISSAGTNLSRLLATQNTTRARARRRTRKTSSSSGECQPPMKVRPIEVNCSSSSEVFSAKSGSIFLAETTPRS